MIHLWKTILNLFIFRSFRKNTFTQLQTAHAVCTVATLRGNARIKVAPTGFTWVSLFSAGDSLEDTSNPVSLGVSKEFLP